LWIEFVPDPPSIVIIFLFPVVMDFDFSLLGHFLLEFLPVWIFHSGFVLPRVLLEYGCFTIPHFREAVFMDPGFVAPS
jgi:hypothetical protein